MLFDSQIPLPARGSSPSASLDAFVSLCELTNILDDLSLIATSSVDEFLSRISDMGRKLDEWKSDVDTRGLLLNTSAPGVRSLHLIYLGARLMAVRATWDRIGTGPEHHALQHACQEGCLRTCEDIITFVCGLSKSDLDGYWSSRECCV
jgi:hypothetical protein